MNIALYEYFHAAKDDVSIYRHRIGRGWNDQYLRRTGRFERAKPEWVLQKDTSNKSAALKEDKWVFVIPRDWDPNLVDGLYVYATIRNGKVFFGRKTTNLYNLEFSFPEGLARMMGYSIIHGMDIPWHTFEHSKWNTVNAPHFPNMDVQTLNAMWIMCDIIENTTAGHHHQIPLLRIVTADIPTQTHSFHNFATPQFRKITQNRVSAIKISIWEDFSGRILDIYSNMFLRLEFEKNAE